MKQALVALFIIACVAYGFVGWPDASSALIVQRALSTACLLSKVL